MVIMGNTDWIGMSSHVTRNGNLISFNLGGKGTDVKWGGGEEGMLPHRHHHSLDIFF